MAATVEFLLHRQRVMLQGIEGLRPIATRVHVRAIGEVETVIEDNSDKANASHKVKGPVAQNRASRAERNWGIGSRSAPGSGRPCDRSPRECVHAVASPGRHTVRPGARSRPNRMRCSSKAVPNRIA